MNSEQYCWKKTSKRSDPLICVSVFISLDYGWLHTNQDISEKCTHFRQSMTSPS